MYQPAKWFEKAAIAVSSLFLAILFVLLLTDVILRWLRIEFYWGSEGGGLLMAWLIFLAVPMVMRTRSHIATDFLVTSMPPRWAALLRVVAHLVMLAYILVLTWLCADLAYRNWLGGARTQGILRLPIYYVETGIVAGLCLMIITQALVLIEEIKTFLQGGKQAE